MSKTGIGLGLLLGVAIGAGIGVLLAPDKGTETRKKIKGKIDDTKTDLKNKYKEAKEKFNVEEKYDELVSDLSHKSEDVISFLESKLAALKKEVAKY